MILVTGGTGLVGSHLLTRLLTAGEEIVAIKRSGSDVDVVKRLLSFYYPGQEELASKIHWVDVELTDPLGLLEITREVKTIYHCAALVSFDHASHREMMRLNVEGTANLAQAALENQVHCFCHISSVAALGRTGGQKTADEKSWWTPAEKSTRYAVSKFASEQEVWRTAEEGLPVVIVNPSVILGPGTGRRGTGEIFRMVEKGLRFYPTGSSGFVDAMDVAAIMIELVNAGIRNERFVVSAENLSWQELLGMISQQLEKTPPSFAVGKRGAALGWRAGSLLRMLTGKKIQVTRDSTSTMISHFAYDNSKIINTLGYKFLKAEDSIRKVVQYNRSYPTP